MSSEIDFLEEGNLADPCLTEYRLADPNRAIRDIIGSITSGERITLKARTSAGMGKISVKAATVNVKALFTGLERVVEADGLFEPNSSPRLEARGTTNYPSSSDSDQRPLTVVFQQSDGNRVNSGHFFLETKEYP